jgi:hypothetical protein
MLAASCRFEKSYGSRPAATLCNTFLQCTEETHFLSSLGCFRILIFFASYLGFNTCSASTFSVSSMERGHPLARLFGQSTLRQSGETSACNFSVSFMFSE